MSGLALVVAASGDLRAMAMAVQGAVARVSAPEAAGRAGRVCHGELAGEEACQQDAARHPHGP